MMKKEEILYRMEKADFRRRLHNKMIESAVFGNEDEYMCRLVMPIEQHTKNNEITGEKINKPYVSYLAAIIKTMSSFFLASMTDFLIDEIIKATKEGETIMTKQLPLEKQVVSLELAKKMKELGFEQDSLFYWSGDENGFLLGHYEKVKFVWKDKTIYSAYTVGELGMMLPKKIKSFNGWAGFIHLYHRDTPEFYKGKKIFEVVIDNIAGSNYDPDRYSVSDVIESDARAKMLIYLKESNLL